MFRIRDQLIMYVLVKRARFPASRQSAAPSGLACPVRARRAASPQPPLSQHIKTRRPSLLFHVCFLFPSYTGHPPRFCRGLRPFVCGPSPIVKCSIAASGEASAPARPEHHSPSISRSLDRSSHALLIAHPYRSLRASRVVLS